MDGGKRKKAAEHVGDGAGDWVMETKFTRVGPGKGNFVLRSESQAAAPTERSVSALCLAACVLVALLLVVLAMVAAKHKETDQSSRKVSTTTWLPTPRKVTASFLAGQDLVSLVDLAARGEAAEIPGRQHLFEVDVDHSMGKRFGFHLTSEYNSLYINSLQGGGLIGDWSAENPEQEVRVGDRIVSANGRGGSASELLDIVDRLQPLRLKLLRVDHSPMSAPQPIDYFDIVVDRTAGEDLGALLSPAGETLLIEGIEGGVFAEWSDQNPAVAVHPGDRIVSVNNVRGSGEALLAECQRNKVLEITLLKGLGAVKTRVVRDIDAPGVKPPPPVVVKTAPSSTSQIPHTAASTITTTSVTAAATTTTAPTTLTTTTVPTTTTAMATTTTIATTIAVSPAVHFGDYVRGLKAEFWYHIDRDIDVRKITISRREFYTMMRTRPPDYVRLDKQVYYPVTVLGWGGELPQTDNFAARWTGQLLIRDAGMYTFLMKSDDGSALNIDGHPVIGRHAHPDWDQHEWQAEPARTRYLSSGDHEIEIVYFDTFHLAGLIIKYCGPDTGESLLDLPAVALRTRVADLPESALHDDSFLAKYEGSVRQRWPLGSGLRWVHVCAALLACAAVYGASVLGLRWRRRQGTLRQALAVDAEELRPCCS